jgi:hypothetical protein
MPNLRCNLFAGCSVLLFSRALMPLDCGAAEGDRDTTAVGDESAHRLGSGLYRIGGGGGKSGRRQLQLLRPLRGEHRGGAATASSP